MLDALRVYKEVGYPYMIMPDHVPVLSGPAAREVGFGYSYGYIHAAMQVVNQEKQRGTGAGSRENRTGEERRGEQESRRVYRPSP